MREIKFRAWGRELVDDEPTLSEPFELTEICKECGTFNGATGVDMYSDYILMQYTGLKDKNGVEIYESDIVQWPGDKGVAYDYEVEWIDGGWFAGGQWLSDINDVVSVIGNKYEIR